MFNINTALPSYTALLSCSPPSHLNSDRWPLRQRREHKVITSKSQRLAYVKPETIGKSAAERDRCGSWPCLCPQRVCQRCSYRPLCFPHKKKINSADYQASITYLLLTSCWERLMTRADVRDGQSDRGEGHSRHQYTLINLAVCSPTSANTTTQVQQKSLHFGFS